jgi:transposase-like protein
MTTNHDRWAGLLADFDTSDLTVQEFCERCGVSAASFYRWRRLLRTDRRRPAGRAAFVEAMVRHVDVPRSARSAESAAPVVELGRRFRVAVPPGFDESTVARLLFLLVRLEASVGSEDAPVLEARR